MSIKNIVKYVKDKLCANDKILWKNELIKSDKLRTYKLYKTELLPEWYCILPLPRDHRRTIFKFRSCTLPLHVETGRYSMPKLPLNERLCKMCTDGSIEDEKHFILNCSLYTDLRQNLLSKASNINTDFNNMPCEQKLTFLMQCKELQFTIGMTLSQMFNRRKIFS